MSKQIAVRLPDEIVAFIDGVVADGDASSRADVVSRALKREQRRRAAERDAAIYAATEPDPDFVALAKHQAAIGFGHLD